MKVKHQPWSLLVLIFIVTSCISASCDKKKDTEDDQEPEKVVYCVASVNGSSNEYSRYKYFLIQTAGTFENNVLFFGSGQEKIQLVFRGLDEGVYPISAGDSTTRIRYYDAAGRMFKADSGSISVDELTFRNGSYTLAGGFAFNAYFKAQFADTSYMVKAAVRNGGFIPIRNN